MYRAWAQAGCDAPPSPLPGQRLPPLPPSRAPRSLSCLPPPHCQVPGWRVVAAGGAPAIQHEWAVKDAESAGRLVDSINALAAEQGHAPARVEAVGGTTVIAVLTTAALGERAGGGGGWTRPRACSWLPRDGCILNSALGAGDC
jgi:hypothetical protein